MENTYCEEESAAVAFIKRNHLKERTSLLPLTIPIHSSIVRLLQVKGIESETNF